MKSMVLSIKTLRPEGLLDSIPTIAIAIDLDDHFALDGLVKSIVHDFIAYRTTCSPGTYNLLITAVGNLDANAFASAWKEQSLSNSVLSVYAQSLANADILVGTKSGEVLATASLID